MFGCHWRRLGDDPLPFRKVNLPSLLPLPAGRAPVDVTWGAQPRCGRILLMPHVHTGKDVLLITAQYYFLTWKYYLSRAVAILRKVKLIMLMSCQG